MVRTARSEPEFAAGSRFKGSIRDGLNGAVAPGVGAACGGRLAGARRPVTRAARRAFPGGCRRCRERPGLLGARERSWMRRWCGRRASGRPWQGRSTRTGLTVPRSGRRCGPRGPRRWRRARACRGACWQRVTRGSQGRPVGGGAARARAACGIAGSPGSALTRYRCGVL